MPRKARVLVPNCPHHIVQRGHNRNAVFVTGSDYQCYLDNLHEWKESLNIKLYVWCLMTNHIHLIVEAVDEPMDLSTLMKRVNGRQSAYVNKLEKRSGSLWEGRYKVSPIQQESYLLSCLRYVELNPVRAVMVSKPEDYQWSSYRERLGLEDNTLLDFDQCYLRLGKTPTERNKNYKEFISLAIPESEKDFITTAFQRNQLTGNQQFVDEIERRIGVRVEQRGRGRPKKDKQ